MIHVLICLIGLLRIYAMYKSDKKWRDYSRLGGEPNYEFGNSSSY